MGQPLHIALLEQSWRAADNPLLSATYKDGAAALVILVLPQPPSAQASDAARMRHQWLLESAATGVHQLRELGATAFAVQRQRLSALMDALAQQHTVKVWREEDPLGLFNAELDATNVQTLPLFTLLHPNDLPIKRKRIPDVFKDFKKQIAPFVMVRRPSPAPAMLPPASAATRAICEAFATNLSVEPSTTTAPNQRIEQWFASSKRVEKYHLERHKLDGDTTQLSPLLRCGAISVRTLWWATKRYETTHGHNKGTAQLRAQLLRRCFYRLLAVKHGTSQLQPGGLLNLAIEWQEAPSHLRAWQVGQTGYPIVDAGMRELNATGKLSNRGRRIAASFLTRYLGINWQSGERYFAQQLIDYDPYNNLGNWQLESGVGEDVRQFRFLDVLYQSERFDPEGAYIKRWIPELRALTATQIHQPWQLSESVLQQTQLDASVYADPIVEAEPSLKQNAMRYKTALDSAGLKYPKSLVSRFVRKHEQKRRW